MAKVPDLVVSVTVGTVIRPGDTAVATMDRLTSCEEADAFRRAWEERMPGVGLTVLAGGVVVGTQRAKVP